jgi:hypothetical protein
MKYRSTYFLSIFFIFYSCSWFDDNPTLDIELTECSPAPLSTQSDFIHAEKAVVRHLITNVNGDTIKKWIIVPEYPENIIYEACNLPDTVKREWIKIDIVGHKISPYIDSPHDTILHGITHVQLISLKVKQDEID